MIKRELRVLQMVKKQMENLNFFLGKCNLIKQKGSICMRELKDKRSLSDNFGDSIYICEGN